MMKRRIASWLLLAVFVPMLLLSSVHLHEDVLSDDSCTECVHHHCGGHVSQSATAMHACVLCQFLTLTMLTAAMMAVTLLADISKKNNLRLLCGCCADRGGLMVTRGPPVA